MTNTKHQGLGREETAFRLTTSPLAEAVGRTIVLSLAVGVSTAVLFVNAVADTANTDKVQVAKTRLHSQSDFENRKPTSTVLEALLQAALESVKLSAVATVEIAKIWTQNSHAIFQGLQRLLADCRSPGSRS